MKLQYISRRPEGIPRATESTIKDFVNERQLSSEGLGKLVTLLWEKGLITGREIYDTFADAADHGYGGASNP